MSDILEIHEFFVEGGSEKRSHVLLHISEPSTAEEKQKGYFFAVTEIDHGTIEQIKEVQRMIDGLESDYFGGGEGKTDSSFEDAVREVNRRGHHLLNAPGSRVHCFVGVLGGNTLMFATHGSPDVGLLYRERDDVTYTDIRGDEEDGDRLFSSVLSGSLGSGDFLYIATPHVRDYFPPDRVQKLLAGRGAEEGAVHMEKVLASLRDGRSYGGLLLHILPKEVAPKTGTRPKYLTANTADAPMIHPPPQAHQREEETNVRPRGRKHSREPLAALILVGIGRAIVLVCAMLVRGTKSGLKLLGRFLIFLVILTTNKGGQREIVLGDIKRKAAEKREWLRKLPLMSKALLLLTVLSAGVFAGSIISFRYAAAREEKITAYRNQVQTIRDKKDAAEASSIYGDDAQAMTLLKETESFLQTLPKRGEDERNTANILAGDIEGLLRKIRKWAAVESEAIAVLTDAAAGAAATRLAAIDGTLIAYGTDDPLLYRVRPGAQGATAVPLDDITSLLAANTPKEQDTIIFASGERSIAAYEKQSERLAARDIAFISPETRIRDLFVYNQRLFVLDTATNQIFRHAKTQTGYDRGVAWIKDVDVILSGAVGLAIDGDIFILTEGGVRKFSSGVEQSFDVTGLDPALDHPVAIWTYNDVKNLYILEPANKRLIVLDKTGKLMKQYTDPAWVAPSGMVVDEGKKTVYILDSNIVYKVTLE